MSVPSPHLVNISWLTSMSFVDVRWNAVGTFQNWNPDYQNKYLRSRLENGCQSIVNHQDSKKGENVLSMHGNLIIFVECEIHYDCFLSKELLGMDDWPSMEQRNQRQVRYPSGKVRNQVAVDIIFQKYQYECLCHFGGKESIPGDTICFFFQRGIKSPIPKYTVHL